MLNGKKLVSKIKNASKFCEIHFKNIDKINIEKSLQNKEVFCASDLWIISKLNDVVCQATAFFEKFEYASARDVVETFFWKDFCDTYLELIKTRIYNDDQAYEKPQQSAIITLHHVLDLLLRLFAPFLPYTAEEVYMDVLKKDSSVHTKGNWPQELKSGVIKYSDFEIAIFYILEEARKAKTQRQLSMKAPIKLIKVSGLKIVLPDDLIQDLKNVTCAESLEIAQGGAASNLSVEIVF